MPKLIVVIGITSRQGGSVARTFLQHPEWKVRGITRNPASEAAQKMSSQGAEIVQGDLDDLSSLVRAFQGATAIFCNTNYFEHLFGAMENPEAISSSGASGPKEYAYARELAQRLNVLEAAGDSSVLATLERFVVSSLCDTKRWSNGKYLVHHFDGKAEAVCLTRERFPGVAAKMSTVRMGHNLETWRGFLKMAPQKLPDGSFVLTRQSSPTFKVNFLATEKDAGAFVKAAVDMKPGKDILAVSKYMSYPDYVSRDEFFAGVPSFVAELIGDDFDFMQEFGFNGGDEVLYPDQLDVKVPVTDLEQWVREEDWSKIQNA